MPSYTVTYGDDRPSRPSSKFANPAHGIMGVLGTSGSDPRERGRKRSRSEIEAASRAEYLAKKEHLAKIKGMRDTERAAEAEKKTSAARARVLARPDVQEQIDSKEGNRLQQEARKVKKVERLTPEQSLAKGQAEKRQRDAVERERVKALPSTAMSELMAERKPEDSGLMASLNKQNTINDWLGTSGPDLRPEQYPAQYDRDAEPAAPAKPAAPAAPAAPVVRGDNSRSPFYIIKGGEYDASESLAKMRPYISNPNFKEDPNDPYGAKDKDGNPRFINGENSAAFRKQAEEEFANPSGRARPVAKPAQPVQGLLAQSAAEQNMDPKDREFVQGQRRAYQGTALPYTLPTGLANHYGGEGGRILMSDTLGALEGVPGAISTAFGAVGRGARAAKDTVDAGVGTGATAIGNMFGEYTPGPGGQKMLDQAADLLEPRVSPAIDSATRYGSQKFSDAMTAVNLPLAEGGLRFDPGVRMPPQREVGGATGGSIGAPTAPRQGVQPTMFESLVGLLPQASPDAMSSGEASMKANDAWRAEMERAEAEARIFGPPAPKKPKKK